MTQKYQQPQNAFENSSPATAGTDDFWWTVFPFFFFFVSHKLLKCTRKYVCIRIWVYWHVLLSIVSWGGNKIRCSHEILQFLRTFNGRNRRKRKKKYSAKHFLFISCFCRLFLFLLLLWDARRKKKWTRFETLHLVAIVNEKKMINCLLEIIYYIRDLKSVPTHFSCYKRKMPNNFI